MAKKKNKKQKNFFKYVIFILIFFSLFLLTKILIKQSKISPKIKFTNDEIASITKLVAKKFISFKNIPSNSELEYHDDLVLVWIVDDLYQVSNEKSAGVTLSFNYKNSDLISSKEEIINNINSLDELMLNNGFIINEENFIDGLDTILRNYRKAYQKENINCVIDVLYFDSASYNNTFTFSCTDNLLENQKSQMELLKDLNLGGFIQTMYARNDEFAYFNVISLYWFGGNYVIAKKIDGKWTEVISGQDIPECESLRKNGVPESIWNHECIILDGDKYTEVQYEL